MPKVHNIGSQRFFQFIKFPVEWEGKFWVRGWTQEIEEPFRTATPLILRMPQHRALVVGVWTGSTDEEEALSKAMQRREVTYDDFREEAGWTPAAKQDREEGGYDPYFRTHLMGGELDVHDRETPDLLAEVPKS